MIERPKADWKVIRWEMDESVIFFKATWQNTGAEKPFTFFYQADEADGVGTAAMRSKVRDAAYSSFERTAQGAI